MVLMELVPVPEKLSDCPVQPEGVNEAVIASTRTMNG